MKVIKRNQMAELSFYGPEPEGSFVQVDVTAVIQGPEGEKTVKGFYAGEGTYKVRFLPETEGHYTCRIQGIVSGHEEFEAEKADEGYHGIVRASGTHFSYQDGKNFAGFGTTVYALANQSQELIDQTIRTLSKSPFNKVRMCVFPKHYNYNHNEPEHYAFHLKKGVKEQVFSEENRKEHMENPVWDVHHPDFFFWDHFERRMKELEELGIQVDLILFHPYDRWGFSTMSREENLVYLDYVLRRFSAIPNLWWSLCNEYDFCPAKNMDDWDAFGYFLMENDPYHHLIGNHNGFPVFDPSREYITHVSLQNHTMSRVAEFQKLYKKPVCYDECCYEGNLSEDWGNISAKEMTRRFWQATVTGGHCTHGETYLDPDLAYDNSAVVWWARGGKLIGESPARIAFLRELVESLPGVLDPYPVGLFEVFLMNGEEQKELLEKEKGNFFLAAAVSMSPRHQSYRLACEVNYAGRINDDVFLFYGDLSCYARKLIELPADRSYRIEVIDTWNMTRELYAEHVSVEAGKKYEVRLPGREYMAVLAVAEDI